MNLHIHVDQPSLWYSATYLFAFLSGFGFLVFWGWRRRLPTTSWWLVISCAFLFFIVGTQLVRWNVDHWQTVLQYQPLNAWVGRSVMGGILFFVPAVMMARSYLRFQHNVADAFAFVFPLGLAIQRVGCLAAGCCFGTITTTPWSITYGPGSEVFGYQQHLGLIPSTAQQTMPVHPAQLYDLLLCVACMLVAVHFKGRVRKPGSLLLVVTMVYGIGRFMIEFVRSHNVTEGAFGFSIVQLAILALLPILIVWILRRESRYYPIRVEKVVPSVKRQFVFGLTLLFIFLVTSRWMSSLEVVSILIALIPLLIVLAMRVFTALTIPSLRIVSLGLICAGSLLMGQTYPEYAKDKSKKLSYWTFGYGTGSGESITGFGVVHSSCGRSYADMYSNEYRSSGFAISHVKQIGPDEGTIAGVNIIWGNHNERVSHNIPPFQSDKDYNQFGIGPYFQRNWRNVGLGIGFSAGSFTRLINVDRDDRSSIQEVSFYPSLHLRLGHLREGFLEYRFAQQFPSPFPALEHQLSVGMGMGKHGGVIRVGTGSHTSLFVAPSFTFGKNFVLEPYVGFGAGYLSSGEQSGGIASINMHVRLGHKED